ncbi:MAG: hypothetical protein ACLFM0_08545 [Spirochaetales bacterium]
MESTKTVLIIGAIVLVFASACVTEPARTSSANIANPEVSLSPLEREHYEVIATVSGRGSVTRNETTGEISGDSERYGYTGGLPGAGADAPATPTFIGIPLGSGEVEMPTPEGASAKSRANAAYEMIMEARGIDADAIVFITMTEEVDTDGQETTYSVETRGRAIRIVGD